jgi:uncharacterized membrane protein
MDNQIWAKMHGASVHFPIAMVLCSALLDIAGNLFAKPGVRERLQAAGYWTMLIGAVGTVPAVVSGLVMSRGTLLGHDQLRLHHLFAWPAFGLIVGTATWRALARWTDSKPLPLPYLAVAGASAGLVMAAGYWGGEMLLSNRIPGQ